MPEQLFNTGIPETPERNPGVDLNAPTTEIPVLNEVALEQARKRVAEEGQPNPAPAARYNPNKSVRIEASDTHTLENIRKLFNTLLLVAAGIATAALGYTGYDSWRTRTTVQKPTQPLVTKKPWRAVFTEEQAIQFLHTHMRLTGPGTQGLETAHKSMLEPLEHAFPFRYVKDFQHRENDFQHRQVHVQIEDGRLSISLHDTVFNPRTPKAPCVITTIRFDHKGIPVFEKQRNGIVFKKEIPVSVEQQQALFAFLQMFAQETE